MAMDPERWRAAEDLFHVAADLPPSQRGAFLEQRCDGDAKLQEAVERLLAEDIGAGTCIAAAVGSAAAGWADVQTVPMIGRRIGPYRVAELIGEGGMGSVYRAVRCDEFRQEVAL